MKKLTVNKLFNWPLRGAGLVMAQRIGHNFFSFKYMASKAKEPESPEPEQSPSPMVSQKTGSKKSSPC